MRRTSPSRHTSGLALILVSLTGVILFISHARDARPVADTLALPSANSTEAHEAPLTASAAAPVRTAPARAPTEIRAASAPLSEPAVSSPAETPAAEAAPLASLTIAGTGTSTYPLVVADGTTLLAAMRLLAASSTFAFTSYDYPGMGAFIDSIAGLKNADGYYWILSVNGEKSSLGASSIVLHQGDSVTWRYEKGY